MTLQNGSVSVVLISGFGLTGLVDVFLSSFKKTPDDQIPLTLGLYIMKGVFVWALLSPRGRLCCLVHSFLCLSVCCLWLW